MAFSVTKPLEYWDFVIGILDSLQEFNINRSTIILNIKSHTCPDLTVIDLPGITRIRLKGSDQGEDIEKVTTGSSNTFYTSYNDSQKLLFISSHK